MSELLKINFLSYNLKIKLVDDNNSTKFLNVGNLSDNDFDYLIQQLEEIKRLKNMPF